MLAAFLVAVALAAPPPAAPPPAPGPDSDGDGIPDSEEDKNHNGIVDPGESDPKSVDTDGDNVLDGDELMLGGHPTG